MYIQGPGKKLLCREQTVACNLIWLQFSQRYISWSTQGGYRRLLYPGKRRKGGGYREGFRVWNANRSPNETTRVCFPNTFIARGKNEFRFSLSNICFRSLSTDRPSIVFPKSASSPVCFSHFWVCASSIRSAPRGTDLFARLPILLSLGYFSSSKPPSSCSCSFHGPENVLSAGKFIHINLTIWCYPRWISRMLRKYRNIFVVTNSFLPVQTSKRHELCLSVFRAVNWTTDY